LGFHLPFVVHENSWEILIRVVWYTRRRDTLQKFGGRELPCQRLYVMVNQIAEWNAKRLLKSRENLQVAEITRHKREKITVNSMREFISGFLSNLKLLLKV